MEMQLDEETLQQIADVTEGAYFRATDMEELMEIYNRIDELERTEIEMSTFVNYTDRFLFLALPALALLVVQLVASELWLREIP
jgi:Ca-activated chloride channel family protein